MTCVKILATCNVMNVSELLPIQSDISGEDLRVESVKEGQWFGFFFGIKFIMGLYKKNAVHVKNVKKQKSAQNKQGLQA